MSFHAVSAVGAMRIRGCCHRGKKKKTSPKKKRMSLKKHILKYLRRSHGARESERILNKILPAWKEERKRLKWPARKLIYAKFAA